MSSENTPGFTCSAIGEQNLSTHKNKCTIIDERCQEKTVGKTWQSCHKLSRVIMSSSKGTLHSKLVSSPMNGEYGS